MSEIEKVKINKKIVLRKSFCTAAAVSITLGSSIPNSRSSQILHYAVPDPPPRLGARLGPPPA